MLKQGLQNQGKGLDCFGRMFMTCLKCLNTKRTSQMSVGYGFVETEFLDRILVFLSFGVFQLQSNRAMHCNKFTNM